MLVDRLDDAALGGKTVQHLGDVGVGGFRRTHALPEFASERALADANIRALSAEVTVPQQQ